MWGGCLGPVPVPSVDTWLDTLVAQGVEVVVDVRDLPLSRRKGFSKSALRGALAARGVEYVHVKALGNPKALRDALKSGLPFDEFAATFDSLLDDREESLRALATLVTKRVACLVCFEEDPARCHRSLIAGRVAELAGGEVRVEHLRNAC
jgi:uncharacterized protein (DUF488 family)